MNSPSSTDRKKTLSSSIHLQNFNKNHKYFFQSEIISTSILNQILEKAEQVLIRKSYISKIIEEQKLKNSQEFTINNCGEVLENFFIQHECLSPKMTGQQVYTSPSKSPFSFLNYDDMDSQTERNQMLEADRQRWETRRDSSKIHNCNKVYIVKKIQTRKDSTDRSSSIKSLKLNDTMPSGFGGRLSHKPEVKKLSVNHNAFIPRLSSRGRLTTNPFNSSVDNGSRSKFLQLDNASIFRTSFYDEKKIEKSILDHSRVIKLQALKQKASQKHEQKQRETNQYISFLRDRKEKLQNIMKSFDLDDMLKKNTKIQRQNLMRDSKTQNLAETYSKVPSLTTDYDGNLIHLNDPKGNIQGGNQRKSVKKSHSNLPKYQPAAQGNLSNSVTFKIKDIDDKTKNFLNQIFSSAHGSPNKTIKKIAFNTKSFELNCKRKKERTQNHLSSKISLTYEEKKFDDEKSFYQPSFKAVETSNNTKISRSNFDNSKVLQSSLKIPLKSVRRVMQNSISEDDKENSIISRNSQNHKTLQSKSIKGKGILKSEPSHRENIKDQHSLRDLEKICRQGYALKKQRIHPNFSKARKITTISTEEHEQNKIVEVSNENSQRNQVQPENQPLKGFFDLLLSKALK